MPLVETGVVVLVLEGGLVRVEVQRTEACARCGICRVAEDGRTMTVLARNDAGAREGDRVELAIPSGVFLPAAAMVFLMPLALAALLAGAFWRLGRFFGEAAATASAVVGGVGGLALAGCLLRWYDRRSGERLVPVVARVLEEAPR